MTFIFSNFFWLIPLVSVPLIIHLLKKRSYVEIQFSSLKFFKIIKSDTIKRNNLVNILLLILRTLIILIIILILSRPVYKNNDFNRSADSFIILLLDNSPSNYFNLTNNYSKFVNTIKNKYKPSTEIIVYYIGETKSIYSGFLSDYKPNIKKHKVNFNIINTNTISNQNLTDKYTQYNKNLFIYSDFHDSSINKDLAVLSSNLVDWNIIFYKSDFNYNNLSITDLTVSNNIIVPNEIVTISSTIYNNTKNSYNDKIVSLYINNVKVGSTKINLDSLESEEIRFQTSYPDFGNHNCYVELQNDDFLLDNKFYFNVYIPNTHNISIIHNNDDDIYFLSNFITAFNEKYKNINAKYFSYNDYITSDNSKDKALFIIGYEHLTKILLNKVKDRNTNIILMPSSDHVINKDISSLLNDRSLSNMKRGKISNNSFTTINPNNAHDSFFNELLNKNSNRNIKVYNFMDIDPGLNTVVNLNNNKSFLNKYKINKNIIHLLTVGLNINDSNLPLKGIFIPLLYNFISNKTPSYNTFNTFDTSIISEHFSKSFNIIHEDNIFKTDNTTVDKKRYFKNPGFYKLKNNENTFNLSLNINPSELNTQFDVNEVERTLNRKILVNNKGLVNFINLSINGVELRKYLIYLLAFFLLIEMYLSNIYLYDRKK